MQKYGDVGNPERHARNELIITEVEGQPRTQVKKKPPIETYYNKGQISASQLAAGQALYRYYMNGWVGYNNCEYREPVDGGGQDVTMTEKQVAAQQQYKKGMAAVKSFKDARLVEKVCVEEAFLSDLHPVHNPDRLWKIRKAAKQRLFRALNDIAKVYHYA